jgi:hypothetical protein
MTIKQRRLDCSSVRLQNMVNGSALIFIAESRDAEAGKKPAAGIGAGQVGSLEASLLTQDCKHCPVF